MNFIPQSIGSPSESACAPRAKPNPPLVRTYRASAMAALAATLTFLSACQSMPAKPPLAQPRIDLARYMGDWYVIASIPTWLERDAHDAVETYKQREDGKIATTFTYRKNATATALEEMTPLGTVVDTGSNAVWTMQFIWPFEADYRILHVDPAYREVVVGRQKRDYVWIMSRTPSMPEADYQRLVAFVATQGYDVAKLRKVPQRAAGAR